MNQLSIKSSINKENECENCRRSLKHTSKSRIQIRERLWLRWSRLVVQLIAALCHRPSKRVHSRYQRCGGRLTERCGAIVQIQLLTRKLFCLQEDCKQKIFCERIPRVVDTRARQTIRLNNTLCLIAFMLSGHS